MSRRMRMIVLATAGAFACVDTQPFPTAPEDPRGLAPLANSDLTAAPDPLNCTGYPEPRIWLESQSWWSAAGVAIPSSVGEHVHVGMCWPTTEAGGDAVVDGAVRLDARVLLHGSTGRTNWLRFGLAGKSTISVPLVIGAGDADAWVPLVLDVTTVPSGRYEFRISANVPKTIEGKRHFNSAGWQICVRACAPSYRKGFHTEARGWYDGHGYQHAKFQSALPVSPLSGNWTFSVRTAQAGSGGVFVDPDFHHGSEGLRVAQGGIFNGALTIDTRALANGPHRLVIVSSDGQNAGVQVVGFTVSNQTTAGQ